MRAYQIGTFSTEGFIYYHSAVRGVTCASVGDVFVELVVEFFLDGLVDIRGAVEVGELVGVC